MKPDLWIAFDPILGRRVVHVKRGNEFISLVTGHKFLQEKS